MDVQTLDMLMHNFWGIKQAILSQVFYPGVGHTPAIPCIPGRQTSYNQSCRLSPMCVVCVEPGWWTIFRAVLTNSTGIAGNIACYNIRGWAGNHLDTYFHILFKYYVKQFV